MNGCHVVPLPTEEAIASLVARWNLTEEMARRRWQRELVSAVAHRHCHQTAKGQPMPNTGPITFTLGEVSTYYAARVPHLKQRRAAEWRGACPIHHGKNDNFAVDPVTGRWFCHSTCGRGGDLLELEAALTGGGFPTRKAEVFRLVGRIEPEYRRNATHTNGNSAGTAPTKPTKPTGTADGWREMARYPYVDRDGSLLFEVVRYLKPDGTKTFIQVRPSGVEAAGTTDPERTGGVEAGGIVVGLDAGKYLPDPKAARATGKPTWKRAAEHVDYHGAEYRFRDCPRVPYRLLNVLKAETVYLPEGEKDVHTLEGWGVAASCNPGGSGNSHLYAGWGDYFRDQHIVILPDNDGPGRKHAAAVAAALLSVAASVRIVELSGLPAKGDVTDWRDAGGTFERFRELTGAAAPMDAAALSELRARWGLADEQPNHPAARAEAADGWPKLEPIQSELPPVQAFSEDLLPDSLRPLVADVADRMQVPMDYPAVVVVLCLAGAVNRRAVIQPKANDTGWVIVPNLWGGIIAPPGFMKSPVIQAATRPLNQIQTEWRQEHEEALKDYAREKEEYELRRTAWKEQYKTNTKKGKAAPDRPEDEPEQPKLRRLIVNDATFEALHQTMSENPAGILVIRDELTGWWSQLDRAGREGERAFCLQAWNGDTGHTIDRIGRGTIHVEACCMSMLGGIQPGRLRSYLVDALEDGPSNDGLIQRFQLLVWPDTAPDWSYVDRAPDAVSEQQGARVFRKLVELGAEGPERFRFASDAQELFIEWLAELEAKIRGDELHPALICHLSKYRSLMPSLAALFHLAEAAAGNGGADTVSLGHTRKAAAWCDYLESHARRVYSCIVTPQLRAARELADKIKHRKVGTDGFFSCRDVYLKGWSGLDSPEAVKLASEVLQDAGWVRDLSGESGPFGGRPSNRYEVNPGVWE
jgi:putative DNA primase/helicase